MSAFILFLDERQAGYLSLALELLHRRLSDDALTMPDELTEFQRQVTNSARAGQARPTGAVQREVAHPAPVKPGLLLTEDETAETLRASTRSIRRLVAAGKLPAVKLNGRTRYRRVDVEAYVAGLGPATSMAARTEFKTSEGAA